LNSCQKACLAAVTLVSVILAILTGCGAVGEKYTVIEWSTSYFEKYYVRWFEDFQNLHAKEHVRIKFRAMPSNSQQGIYTMMISDTLSDCVTVFTGISALLLENKALEPVPEGLIDKSDFMAVALSWPTYDDGTLAAVPGGVGIRPFIYYDSEDLRDGGVTTEDVPEDYEGFRSWAEKLFKREAGGKTVIGVLPGDQAAKAKVMRRPLGITRGHVLSAYPFLLAYLDPTPDPETGKSDNSLDDYLGGPGDHGKNRPFRFNTPEFIKGIGEWAKFFVPSSSAIADGNTERLGGLQSDVYAGCEAGNWIFGEVYTIDMRVAALPHPVGRPARLACGPDGEGVSANSKNKKLAFEWVKYMTDTDRQVDAYYGHGYTPGRLSTWKQLDADDKEDQEIRKTLLMPYSDGHGDYICQPQINRISHDTIDVLVFVAFPNNISIVRAHSWEAQIAKGPEAGEAPGESEAPLPSSQLEAVANVHQADAKTLADAVAKMTGERTTVIVQGTPPESVALRSNIRRSPIPAYLPHLENGVFQPNLALWDRIMSEVVASAIQKVSKADGPESPEDVAKWCQEEAEAIVAGKK